MQQKLMKVMEFEGGTTWKVACDCLSNNHTVDLYFEKDSAEPCWYLSLCMEVTARGPEEYEWFDWSRRETWGVWFRKIWWRIKTAVILLFKGHTSFYSEVILDYHGIKAMQMALKEGSKNLKMRNQPYDPELSISHDMTYSVDWSNKEDYNIQFQS